MSRVPGSHDHNYLPFTDMCQKLGKKLGKKLVKPSANPVTPTAPALQTEAWKPFGKGCNIGTGKC